MQQSCFYADSRPNARARHWSQHGNLQCDQRRSAAAYSLQKSGTPGAGSDGPQKARRKGTCHDNAQRLTFGNVAVGRLKPGATLEQAQTAADLVATETRRLFPIPATADYRIRLEPMGVNSPSRASFVNPEPCQAEPRPRSKHSEQQGLRGSSRTDGLTGGALLRNSVVVVEVALCFVLLIGTGLMFRSFLALRRVEAASILTIF